MKIYSLLFPRLLFCQEKRLRSIEGVKILGKNLDIPLGV
jgi:hypothetical protein